jgi:hypothetical protein
MREGHWLEYNTLAPPLLDIVTTFELSSLKLDVKYRKQVLDEYVR